jgi:hypothetical protein
VPAGIADAAWLSMRKRTLLRKRQTKPSVPQLHTGMRCGSGGFAGQSRDTLTSTRPRVTEPRQSRASRASGRHRSVAVTHSFLRRGFFRAHCYVNWLT